MRTLLLALAGLVILLISSPVAHTAPDDIPVELGAVAWRRDFDAAAKEARAAERPLLVLFQEVPG